MTLNHHAPLRAIGATLSKQHTTKEREYWTVPESAEEAFYAVREMIPFNTLLSGFRHAGFQVMLLQPKTTDERIDSLVAALVEITGAYERLLEAHGKPFEWGLLTATNARAAIAGATGSAA